MEGTVFVLALCLLALGVHGFLEVSQGQLSQSDIHALQTRLEDEKEKRILLQNDLEVLMGKFAAFQRDHANLQAERKSVSFTATLSSGVTLDRGQRLIVDNVLTNNGNGYDGKQGQFSPPVNGSYLFIFTTFTHGHTDCYLEIIKSNQPLVGTYSGSSTNAWSESASVSVVTNLVTTDTLWVRSDTVHPSVVNGGTLTGALLSAA